MKRITAIFFLCLFLIYQVGYLGYYWFSLKKIDQEWLSKEIDITPNMKVVSIPINLPYWSSQSTFQPTNGKIRIDGKTYRKVYQKYDYNCIKLVLSEDFATTKLNKSVSDWIKIMIDSESDGNGSEKGLLKNFIKEYLSFNSPTLKNPHLVLIDIATFGQESHDNLSAGYNKITTPPPQIQ